MQDKQRQGTKQGINNICKFAHRSESHQSKRLCCSDRPSLETGITLREPSNGVLVCAPCLATTGVPAKVTKGADNLRWALKELNTETTGDVERNMAMHQPGTGVIGGEGDDEISTSISGVSVTSGWVVEVESCTSTASGAISNDPEIVTITRVSYNFATESYIQTYP
jgi:hypothetical protein